MSHLFAPEQDWGDLPPENTEIDLEIFLEKIELIAQCTNIQYDRLLDVFATEQGKPQNTSELLSLFAKLEKIEDESFKRSIGDENLSEKGHLTLPQQKARQAQQRIFEDKGKRGRHTPHQGGMRQ